MSDPSDPSSYPRRALVCVAGLSPQVVTETIYALAIDSQVPFVPTEVHVVTTEVGRVKVQEELLDRDRGQFFALCKEHLPEHQVDFGPAHVHVIRRQGRPLDDIQTPEDSTAAADTILGLIRELTLDPTCAIHGSIAGGRKSMSFLLGNCMALVGRPQDRLSHVLVNEPFDNPRLEPRFYFPTKRVRSYAVGDKTVPAKDASITLAMVDVVWVFDGIGRMLASGNVSYNQLVEQGRAAMLAQKVVVSPTARVIQLAGMECALTPQEMFVYALLALRRVNRVHEPGMKIAKPGAVVIRDGGRSIGFSGQYFETVRHRVHAVELGPITGANFRSMTSRINKKITEAFGHHLSKRALIVGSGRDRDGHYGLLAALPEDLLVL